MENQFDSLMGRIRARQTELSGHEPEDAKENETVATPAKPTIVKEEEPSSSPVKVFGLSSRLNDAALQEAMKTPVHFRPPESKESTLKIEEPFENSGNSSKLDTSAANNSSAKKASRFSMLAQELDEFEFDYQSQYNKPKEAFMKGRSPKMSIGETRPAVLCTPAGQAAMKSPNIAKSSTSAPDVAPNQKGPDPASAISDFESRRIKFAQPIVNVNYLPNESSIFSGGSSSANDMSTVLGGSAEMMNVTTSSLSCGELSMYHHITEENTIINAQSCDNREAILRERLDSNEKRNMSTDEYGAHTFMRKKVYKGLQTTTTSTAMPATSGTSSPSSRIREPDDLTPMLSSSAFAFTKGNTHPLFSSPKPFSKDVGRAMFAPVNFTPKSTSSPKAVSANSVVFSPSKTAALEGSVATTRRMQLEQQLKANNGMSVIPTPEDPVRATISTSIAPHTVSYGMPSSPHSKPLFPTPSKPLVASAPLPVQTQWRGQANTPVVQGARAEDKTAGTELVGAGIGKLKNLKSRWEFSSATGTPIHPDATEDSLIAAAIRMKESAIPKQIGRHRSITSSRKGPSVSSINSQNTVRSNTASPAAKNLCCGHENNEYDRYEVPGFEDDDVFEPEHNSEHGPLDEDDKLSEEGVLPEDTDTSRFIDNAFGFMEGPGTGTPSPFREAPLAKLEGFVSPKKLRNTFEHSDVIEEEEIGEEYEHEQEPFVEERKQCDATEASTPVLPRTSTVDRKNDSQLAYSVSFYRKIQRDKMGESSGTPLVQVSPSAPPVSLTSPQKLRQLTGSTPSSGDYSTPPLGGRIMENEREASIRLQRAIKVEEQLVIQSKRAMALAREKPSFRGSREEFEAQWALLVHVEKHRALLAEHERLKKEGPRIIDGPRGTITVTQLAVNMARDYVSAHIASSKKSEEVFYFVAVLRYGEQVDVSKMVTSDGGMNRRGVLEFPTPLQLSKIPSDFRAVVEIYGQRSLRESTTHEDKYKLKGSTLKAKNADKWCYYVDRSEQESRLIASADGKKMRLPCKLWKKFNARRSLCLSTRNTFLGVGSSSGGSTSAANQSLFLTSQFSASSCQSNFNLLGTFSFDINCPGKHLYTMQHTVHPLEGVTLMKVRKQAIDGADIVYRGFLSMYQRTGEGLGSWTRYWCTLDNGEMKFWKQPEDEGTKGYTALMDLSTCCRSEGASTVQDICPFPNSFHIDVWAPKMEPGESRGIERLRVMLAADTNLDLEKWLSVINSTSKQLCTWRNPINQ